MAETPCPKSKAEVIGSTPRQRFVPPQGSPLRPRLDIHSIAFWRYFGSHSTATRSLPPGAPTASRSSRSTPSDGRFAPPTRSRASSSWRPRTGTSPPRTPSAWASSSATPSGGARGDPHRHRGFGDERRGRGNPRTRHPQGVPDPHRLRCGRRPRPGFADLGVHARNPDLGRGLLPGALERQEGRRARARRGCRRAGHGRREAHDR